MNNLYDSAVFSVKLNGAYSKPIEVTEGVLQGEILSPLLFILFISDFEIFLRSQNIEGLNIDGLNDLSLLLYADDAVALAQSLTNMKKLLIAIEKYCDMNNLKVNCEKTQVVHFRHDGSSKKLKFYLNDSEIKIVKSYNYLGTKFSNSALGNLATEQAICKAKMASGTVIHTLRALKSDSWECKTSYSIVSYPRRFCTVRIYGAYVILKKWKLYKLVFLKRFCLYHQIP